MSLRRSLIVLLLISTSYSSFAQIAVGTNFEIRAGLPIDSRIVVANTGARDAINNLFRYEGLTVYVVDIQTNYQLIGGITNSNWQSITSGSFYAAGTGLTLSGNTFSHGNHAGDVSGATTLTVIALQGRSIDAAIPTSGNVLGWNGSAWAPVTDNNTVYTSGTGLILTGTTFAADNTSPIWNANQIMGTSISTTGPIGNQILKWNGSEWTPADEQAYDADAGSGIILSANTFFADNNAPLWNARMMWGIDISTTAPNTNQLLKFDGTIWAPADEVAYDAGTGITLSGNTFSANNSAAIWNANQIMGSAIATNTPSSNEVLTWNGSEWIPAAPAVTYYAAGTGLTLTSNTFNALNNTAMWNADQLQSSTVSASVPTNNQILKYSGGSWTPSDETSYNAGTGISLSGSSFSHIAHTGDAIGATSLTVTGLQGRSIATTIPTTGNVLKWNGSLWAMGSPVDTFNANKNVTRTGWTGVTGVNIGTTTTVADFLNAVFFPFIAATININATGLYEVGTTNTVTISGTRTANNETSFSNGRVDQTYPTLISNIYTFGAAASYSTTITFTPNQSISSTLELRFVAYQGIGGNGSPGFINSTTKIVKSYYPYFHGTTTVNLTSGGTDAYTGLTKLLQASANKTINYNGTGYLYFCYPASYGTLTSILDPSSFAILTGFTRYPVAITSVGLVNNWTQNYYIYQSNTISTPNGNFQFLY